MQPTANDVPTLGGIAVSVEGPIGRLELDRADKLNPLSPATLLALIDAARWFDEQAGVKVVIVSGRGRAFSAGADLAAFAGDPDSPAMAGLGRRDAADAGRRMADAMESMRAVTIAAVHGHCVGGGVVLASACDLRVAADDTRFSIPEVDLGIPLAWGGIPRLVREIGPALTRELVLTCRPFTAEEARAAGFVNRVVPAEQVEAEAEGLAASLTAKSAFTLAATKRGVRAALESMVSSTGAWADADALVGALGDEESREVAVAYLERLGRR